MSMWSDSWLDNDIISVHTEIRVKLKKKLVQANNLTQLMGAVTEINSATSKALHGVGPWAIRSIIGLEFQDL